MIKFRFCWWAFYIGVFWSRKFRIIYVQPFPMIGIRIQLRKTRTYKEIEDLLGLSDQPH